MAVDKTKVVQEEYSRIMGGKLSDCVWDRREV